LVQAILVLWLGYGRWSLRGVAIATIALAALLGSALQWAPNFQMRVEQAADEAQDYERHQATGETSIGLRLHFWKRSAQWLVRHPLLGAGTGGWSDAYNEATKGGPQFLHDRRYMHPHNEYVHLAVQLGSTGLALFAALLIVAFRRARSLPGVYAALATGFVIAFAVGSLVNDFLHDSTEGHLWAILGGALFGAAPQAEARGILTNVSSR
jgi:O-antigen ligase